MAQQADALRTPCADAVRPPTGEVPAAWWDEGARAAASRSAPRLAGGRGSSLGTSFSFLSNILSGGVLGLPFCFQRCGLGLGAGLLVAVLATQTVTLKMLLYASLLHRRASYEELAECALGRAARPVCLACVLFLQFGCLVAFLAILADLVSASVSPIIPPGAEVGRAEYMVVIVLGVLLPLCLLVRSEEALSRTSIFSVVFLCGFTTATLCLAVLPDPDAVLTGLDWWKPDGTALALPVLVFALAGHSAFFSCISSMRSPSLHRADKVLNDAMRGAGIIYAAVGVAGYAAFRQHTSGNLLRNFNLLAQQPGPYAAAVRHLKLGFAFSVAGAVPATALPIRDAFLTALGNGEAAPTPLQHAGVNALILSITLLLAALIPNVEFVFALTGATASIMLAYIFPAAIFLSTQRQWSTPPNLAAHEAARMDNGNDLWARQEADNEISAAKAEMDAGARTEEELLGFMVGLPARVLSWALLVFGAAAMWLCTMATLRAVSEEAAIVAVAQTLVVKSEAAVSAAQALGKATHAACALPGLVAAANCSSAALLPGEQVAANRLHVVDRKDTAPSQHPAAGTASVEEELALAVVEAEAAARRGGVSSNVLQAATAAAELVGGFSSDAAPSNFSGAADAALASTGAVADAAVIAVHDAVATLNPVIAARAKELAAALGGPGGHVQAALEVAEEHEPGISQYKAEHGVNAEPTKIASAWDVDAAALWDEADGAAAAGIVFSHPQDVGLQPPGAHAASIANATVGGTAGFGDMLLTKLSAEERAVNAST
jgi:amino acid permease